MIDSAVLATQRLRREPGYWTVLKALALYRKDRVHELGHGPADFLSPTKDKDWVKLCVPRKQNMCEAETCSANSFT